MIEFLAHRGVWRQASEKNSMLAFQRAFDAGFGVETDIRDLDGELVISHDAPRNGAVRPVEELIAYYADQGHTSMLALNIKSDGLQAPLQELLMKYRVENYFVFDMSIPDTLGYLQRGMTTYIRRSEIEEHPALALSAAGLWLDELTSPWIDAGVIVSEAKTASRLAIVSSELHRRDRRMQWSAIKEALKLGTPPGKLQLCTDFPDEAREYFA